DLYGISRGCTARDGAILGRRVPKDCRVLSDQRCDPPQQRAPRAIITTGGDRRPLAKHLRLHDPEEVTVQLDARVGLAALDPARPAIAAGGVVLHLDLDIDSAPALLGLERVPAQAELGLERVDRSLEPCGLAGASLTPRALFIAPDPEQPQL